MYMLVYISILIFMYIIVYMLLLGLGLDFKLDMPFLDLSLFPGWIFPKWANTIVKEPIGPAWQSQLLAKAARSTIDILPALSLV